jgi:hypothetical protein
MDDESKALAEEAQVVDEAVAMEIECLRERTAKHLQARYRELFGEETRSSNQAHLFRRIAWRLQANAEGGLSERARERARQLADEAALRLRAPRAVLAQKRCRETPISASSRPAVAHRARFSNGSTRGKRFKSGCWPRVSCIETVDATHPVKSVSQV